MKRDREERRGRRDEEGLPESTDGLPAETAQRLMDEVGFTRADLFERRGPATMRGLAHLLEPGDEIVEVHPDHVRIKHPDGVEHTHWNLARLPHWVSPAEPAEEDPSTPPTPAG